MTPSCALTGECESHACTLHFFAGRYTTAPASSLRGAEIWYTSGFLAQLLIKIVLCNLLLALLLCVDPLCAHGGVYETDGASGLPATPAALGEVQAMLRLRHCQSALLWSSLSAVALGNLVYASALAVSDGGGGGEGDVTTPGLVVFAAAGALVVLLLALTARKRARCCRVPPRPSAPAFASPFAAPSPCVVPE